MTTQTPDMPANMKRETVETLQELMRALQDTVQHHTDAADRIKGDPHISKTLRSIAAERQSMLSEISSYIAVTDGKPVEGGTFVGSLRSVWTSLRAALNAGDATVVLIEAERAEDIIVNQFKKLLPEIAGCPINDKLNSYFVTVKSGHDRVLNLRNALQDV